MKLNKEFERDIFVLMLVKRVRVTFPNPSMTSVWTTKKVFLSTVRTNLARTWFGYFGINSNI